MQIRGYSAFEDSPRRRWRTWSLPKLAASFAQWFSDDLGCGNLQIDALIPDGAPKRAPLWPYLRFSYRLPLFSVLCSP